MGKITYIGRNFFEMQRGEELNNGDGLCFVNKQGDLTGFRVNKVEYLTPTLSKGEGVRVRCFPADMPRIETGIFLYRNQDQEFEKILRGKTAERRVGVEMVFKETSTGFSIEMTDEDGVCSTFDAICEKQPAQKPEAVNENIKNQLSKLGNTIYEAKNIDIQINAPWFFPASQLSEWRRLAVEQLNDVREKSYIRETKRDAKRVVFPNKKLTYLGNVTNALSEAFYREHRVEEIMPGFEVKAEEGVPLMFCKHCIKYEMGWCPKQGYKATFKEPLFLKNNDQIYELTFDCKRCEMMIGKAKSDR